MGEKSSTQPKEEPYSECEEQQSERTSDSSKDYISCEELSQEFNRAEEIINSDTTNTVRQQKRKIPSDETEETDYFENTENTPSFTSDDNKVHLKKAVNLEKKIFTDPKKMRLDFDRINELDKFKNIPPARSFFNHSLVPQGEDFKKSVFNYFQDSLPGPSDVMPKKKKKTKKPAEATEEEISMEDVKSIANCILENTLNVLDITGVTVYTDDVIEFNVMETVVPSYQECEDNQDAEDLSRTVDENTTNNSDGILEKIPSEINPETANIHNNMTNENFRTDITTARESPFIFKETSQIEEQEEDAELSVAQASREALFDPNSVPDLLDDFEIPPPLQEADNVIFDAMDFPNGAILIGILPPGNLTDSQGVTNGFPHWLLQILGTQVAAEESVNPAENADEPHYYCQGDGLGVHPSVVAVEVEEDEDDQDDVEESTESSSNNTAAEVDQGLSSQDMSSLPEDSQANTETQDLLPEETNEDEEALLGSSDQVEFYDTLSSSSDIGIATSKSI